ncbi:MAG: anaerobic ribonucleoside-triphosphate reductase activating protein [Lachnospiraceae bacterium]|nr:anaerobic ribonucleoside-triphosphate reductase activating protein [Lachnospiraceae bacterium]
MLIHGLNKLTLLDYPGHMACLVFTGGCDFLCPFCQNKDLVLNPSSQPVTTEDEFFSFLEKRKGVLEGVVITGGEPTLNIDLIPFIRRVKAEGYLVKLDTNGTNPGAIRELLSEGLLDYIAMDIKNSREKYAETSGIPKDSPLLGKIEESVELIKNSGIDYEFRTTVIKEYHTTDDLLSIAAWISGAKAYYLQPFRDCDTLVGAKEGTLHAPERPWLESLIPELKKQAGKVEIRG